MKVYISVDIEGVADLRLKETELDHLTPRSK